MVGKPPCVQLGVIKQTLDPFQSRQDFNEAGIVKVKGCIGRAVTALAEFGQLPVSLWSAHAVADIEAGERADTVDAGGIAERPIVRGFQERVLFHRFTDEFLVAVHVVAFRDDLAGVIAKAEVAVVIFPHALRGAIVKSCVLAGEKKAAYPAGG